MSQVLHTVWQMDSDRLRIDCDTCIMDGTTACEDCVVTFIVGRQPGDAVVVDVVTERALRLLGEGGLLPTLRHQRRQGRHLGA
jgi:hypothetical protein